MNGLDVTILIVFAALGIGLQLLDRIIKKNT